ncbi:hypothetical protein YQE_10988, partial [Dendroctonus ponderosae]
MERVDKLLSSTTNYLSIIKCDTTDRTLPFKCAVYGCANEFTDFKSHQSATFKFHNFPTCERTRRQWLDACGLPEETGITNAKICSDHFTLNDYSRKLKEELLNPGYKRLLSESAVPSVNIRPYSPFALNQLPTTLSEKLYQPSASPPAVKAPGNAPKSESDLHRKIFSLRREVLDLQKKNADSRIVIHHKKASLEASRKKLKKVAQELESILSPNIPDVIGCSNGKKAAMDYITFYYLPKDKFRRNTWMQALNGHILDDTPLSNILICANHFEKNNFEANRSLKKSVVPSIFPVAANSDEPSTQMVRIYTVELRDNFLEKPAPLLSNSVSDLSSIDSDLSSFDGSPSSDSCRQELSRKNCDTQSDELRREMKRLETLKNQLLDEQKQLAECEKELTGSLRLIEKEIQDTELETKLLDDKQLEMLRKCLSPAQIRHLFNKEKAKWSVDDTAVAYTISCMVSRDFYRYMRDQLKFPLPSLSIINRHYRMFRPKKTLVHQPNISSK